MLAVLSVPSHGLKYRSFRFTRTVFVAVQSHNVTTSRQGDSRNKIGLASDHDYPNELRTKFEKS